MLAVAKLDTRKRGVDSAMPSAMCVDLLVGTQVPGLSRRTPLSLRRGEIQHVWALSVCDIAGLPLDVLSVCDNSNLPSDESGNLLNMIMDCGAEEHVVSLVDWKSVEFDCAVRLLTTWEFLAVSWCVDGAITNWWS